MYTKEQQLKKNKKDWTNSELLDQSITVRLSKVQIEERKDYLLSKEICQVCENSMDLDYPHHAIFGTSRKDDRTMINICVDCHRIIHTKGYGPLKKTREQVEKIGWSNNKEFLNE